MTKTPEINQKLEWTESKPIQANKFKIQWLGDYLPYLLNIKFEVSYILPEGKPLQDVDLIPDSKCDIFPSSKGNGHP